MSPSTGPRRTGIVESIDGIQLVVVEKEPEELTRNISFSRPLSPMNGELTDPIFELESAKMNTRASGCLDFDWLTASDNSSQNLLALLMSD